MKGFSAGKPSPHAELEFMGCWGAWRGEAGPDCAGCTRGCSINAVTCTYTHYKDTWRRFLLLTRSLHRGATEAKLPFPAMSSEKSFHLFKWIWVVYLLNMENGIFLPLSPLSFHVSSTPWCSPTLDSITPSLPKPRKNKVTTATTKSGYGLAKGTSSGGNSNLLWSWDQFSLRESEKW